MTTVLHFGDLLQIVVDSGLAAVDDAGPWLEERGFCDAAIDQYLDGIIEAAQQDGATGRRLIEGVFASGLTLGIAVAESRR